MDKTKLVLYFSFGIVILALINSGIYYLIPESEALYSIPPTPAFKFVNSTGGNNITASNSFDTLHITAGENVTAVYFPSNNTIRLSAIGSGFGGDNLGNHIMTQDLNTTGFDIRLTNANDGIILDVDGDLFLSAPNDDSPQIVYDPLVDDQDDINMIFNNLQTLNDNTGLSFYKWNSLDETGTNKQFVTEFVKVADNSTGTQDGSYTLSVMSAGSVLSKVFIDQNIISLFATKRVAIADDNLVIGGNTWSSGQGVLGLMIDTAPSANLANGVMLYAEDVSSSAELKVRDEGGTITTLSPHNFEHVERKAPTDWSFTSFNPYIGKGVTISNYEVLRALEEVTGKTLIHEFDLPPEMIRDWDQDQLLTKQREDESRNEIIERRAGIQQDINKLLNKKILTDDEKNDLDYLQRALIDLEIPDPYIIKPRPAYFDMQEVRN